MWDISNIWPIVGSRDVNDNTFLSCDIYTKGTVKLNNLRYTISDDSLFFITIKGFYHQFKQKIVTTNDFINYVHKSTKHEYTDFFNKILYDTIPPVLQYSFFFEK